MIKIVRKAHTLIVNCQLSIVNYLLYRAVEILRYVEV